jgi:type IV secretory pathway VirB2 component (pilin)
MDSYKKLFFVLPIVFLSVFLLPEVAFAAKGSVLGSALCNVSGWFAGNAGKAIACIGVLILGTMALFGKITWPPVLLVGVGVALLFGAPALVISLGGINCRATFT